MKFSIRDVFLATFAVALALLVWRSGVTITQQGRELAEAKNELALEEQDARQLVNQQQYHQASIERFSLVEGIGKQAELEFRKLQDRYSEITPANEQTVSIRTVPMLTESETGIQLNRTRVYVPEQREVYLILRTVRAVGFHGSNDEPDEPQPPIEAGIVTNGGPFQLRLTPGLHDVDWFTSAKQAGKEMTLNVYLDNQLQSTSSWTPDSQGGSRMHSSFSDQTNFAPTQPLPELAKVLVSTESPEEPFAPGAFQCYLKLTFGDKQSDCIAFPQIEKRDNKP